MVKVQRPWRHPGGLTERMPEAWSCEFPALRDYVRKECARAADGEVCVCVCVYVCVCVCVCVLSLFLSLSLSLSLYFASAFSHFESRVFIEN